ncbi:DUF1294 domain-containing protein [Fonticella tunisiensis]|uniref:Uncharacterized membrane protein YsdA (DUF1294 family) n=1 Tax=Fonticella tunisiensis TaxID=1096341 RepID=A0A4V3ETL1_9CLOT|nr:DUF1294 domain-containing protein [Fonticella tunisiensis]TDT60927.1 uncharacterized membrane protein YsdA (DUF1294 family) [Fonticella tunisiensis]
MNIFVYYLLLVNIIAFVIMYIDKQKAIKNRWRISENTLVILAVLLGSLGILAGMYCFRHKTKHLKFIIGIPVIMIIQLYIITRYL